MTPMTRMFGTVATLTLLASGCSRVPADVSTPTASSPSADADADATASNQAEPPAPIPGACVAAELELCARACVDAECLSECGGEACVATIASLWSCMGPVEQQYEAANPKPALEFREVEVDGELEQEPTQDSLMREENWYMAREDAKLQRWDDSCAARCVAALDPDASEPSELEFCREWDLSYWNWARLSQPPPEHTGVLGMTASLGALGSAAFGSSMALVNADPSHDRVLASLVAMASEDLRDRDVTGCVPDLDSQGRRFEVAITVGEDGRVRRIEPVDGSETDQARCVAEAVAAAMVLPVRVARAHPQFAVEVSVRPGMGLLGASGLGSDAWGSGDWGESGLFDGISDSDYLDSEYGSLGLTGTGAGGGGTAEGLGGLGTGGGAAGIGTRGAASDTVISGDADAQD